MTSSSSNKGPFHNKSIYGIYVKELKYAKITFFEDKVEKVYKKRKESLNRSRNLGWNLTL